MGYKIYELVTPEHLQSVEQDGYYLKTISRYVLEELDINIFGSVDNNYDTVIDAVKAIEKNKEKLKGKELTVVPVINVDYEGHIY